MSQISLVLRISRVNSSDFLRNLICVNSYCIRTKATKGSDSPKIPSSSSSSSGSDSSSDDDILKKKPTKADSLKKLNLLLQQMVKDDKVTSKSTITLAQPNDKRAKKEAEAEPKMSSEEKLSNAAKKVAESLGGDVKQVHSELLQKLLHPIEADVQAMNLSDVIKGMKIDREPKPDISRADQVRQILEQTRPERRDTERAHRPQRRVAPKRTSEVQVVAEKINLFGSEPLNIFVEKSNLKESAENKTWRSLEERDLKLAVTHPPSNYFQQMILWTEQGKLWKFPIDNEQGLEEESNVYFAEHVFLEEHLEPWCPPKGPLRHFMELVCVGLSKNHYLTVQAKKEHIEWYKNYFEDKKKLLQEVGALSIQGGKEGEQKSIEK